MLRRAGILALVVVLGCGGSTPPPSPPVKAAPLPPDAAPADASAPAPAATFPGAPATPAGAQLAWVLDLLAHRAGQVGPAEVQAHFSPTFLASVPEARLRPILRQLAAGATDLAITAVHGNDDKLVAHVTAGGHKLRVHVVVDPATGKMRGLLFQPDVTMAPGPRSFAEAIEQARAIAPGAQLLVARLDHGRCVPLHRLHPAAELAIGSAFKLYVLEALADRIAAGKARWTDELAVRADWKSLPSGVTQDDPAGTRHTLRAFAERMISISDNTAADHLLYFLGRRAVEAAVRRTRHARPALDVPFLSTREMFLLKLGDPAALTRYLALPAARRRAYLDQRLAGKRPKLEGIETWTGARHIDTLEWFASSDDLCRAMAELWTRGQAPATAPVLDVLAKNPGLPIDRKAWPYVGFKGGSEPGVMNLTYLLRRADDAWFVVTAGFNAHAGGTVDEGKVTGLVRGVIELLGKER